MFLSGLIISGFALLVGFIVLKLLIVRKAYFVKRNLPPGSITVGFFHPYCNAGGGGERVLWCAIRSIQDLYPNAVCVVYTGDTDATHSEIIKKARDTFNISLPRAIEFVFLKHRGWVEAKRYPIFTLLGQSLGSILLGFEAIFSFPPDVYLDTMGYAFTLPIFKYLGGSRTGSYVHYPTISTDMLGVVEGQSETFNNRPLIARSSVLSKGKLIYYKLFAYLYGVVGRCSEVILVNSSWTKGHIDGLWQKESCTFKVYPPCDISGFLKLPVLRNDDSGLKYMISIGQFRPEKNHALQIKSFHTFLKSVPETERDIFRLVLIGGCRNDGDKARVQSLVKLAKDLKISDQVEIKTNIPFNDLKSWLYKATIGIHTMANEHFGIGVVEFQAAGVIALAHNSGGPKMDIVQNVPGSRTGFLASDEETYSQAMRKIWSFSQDEYGAVVKAARSSCNRFSEEQFKLQFLCSVETLFLQENKED